MQNAVEMQIPLLNPLGRRYIKIPSETTKFTFITGNYVRKLEGEQFSISHLYGHLENESRTWIIHQDVLSREYRAMWIPTKRATMTARNNWPVIASVVQSILAGVLAGTTSP